MGSQLTVGGGGGGGGEQHDRVQLPRLSTENPKEQVQDW